MEVMTDSDLEHRSPVTLLLQEVLLESRQTVQVVLGSLHIVLKHRRPFIQQLRSRRSARISQILNLVKVEILCLKKTL